MSSDPFGRRNSGGGIGVRLAPLLIGLLLAAFFAFRGCEKGAEGKRHIFAMGVPEEMRLGAQAFQQVLGESDVDRDPATNEAVGRVMRNLIAGTGAPLFLQKLQLPKPQYQWEWRVVRSREVNAFCLPGGKMVVYTGILPVAETEAGLAVVMGHEICHAIARHGSQRMAQQRLVGIAQMSAAGSISDMSPQAQQAVMQAFNVGAKFGVLLPYGRGHETEADRLGLFLMAASGYDPANAPLFWQRMIRVTGGRGQPPEFASTHPGHEHRIADLQSWQAEAQPLYQATPPARDADRPLP